jgi:RNA polymerase sigma-70 factor (ECF subfamily)
MADAATLIRRWCRTGDRRAFHAFYETHAARLWRFLVARGADEETAYDVVADAFERFIGSVCRDPRAPVALLYRIALNRSTDLARRQAVREPARPANPEGLASADPGAEARAEVERLLADLDPGEQNLLLLRYWVGLTHAEVATVLEIPEGTARRRTAALTRRLGGDS